MTQKRAMVTGGSGTIGSAISERLAADGLAVVVHGFQHAKSAGELVDKIRAQGGMASVATFDITDGEETRHAVERLVTDGAIQVIVNNAGGHEDAPMAGM